ncbi:phage tail tape measure protein [Yersinia intermedia]|uniref:phage tail tape measure protein n=1 Tax=Yersinia intermedia TaxID=631 RepID=UPI000B2411B4
MIFGEEAMKGAVKLVEAAGNGKLGDKKTALDHSAGSAKQVADIQTDNLDGDLKNLQSAFEDLQIEVFDKENSSLRQLTQSANQWLTEVGNWVKKNPELTQTLVTVAGSLAALVAALGALGLIAWPVIAGFNALIAGAGFLGTAFSIAGGTITAIFGAITLPVVAAVAVIVAAVLVIRKYWEPISAFFGGVMEGIKAAFLPVGDALAPFADHFGWIADKVKQAVTWFKALIAPVQST